jgi:cyclopropane-fatty-acyl-phospholipid synthase
MKDYATRTDPARTDAGASSAFEHWLLRQISGLIGNRELALELWDGYRVGPDRAETTLAFRDRGALYASFYKPELQFGELFMAGRLEVRGDLVRAMEMIYRGQARMQQHGNAYLGLMQRLFARRARSNTLSGSKRNIHEHYDLGNDFYRMWLDRAHMQYTCAYYPTPAATLEEAQGAKLELVCRKLNLKPGERVVEAGGGWGGLARYMARYHGVHVRSYNISAEQVAWARERAREEGLEDRVEYVEDDYRNITGDYDAFVSVGMLEHVGVANYGALGATIDRCLKDDGRGLIHSIGQDQARPLNEWIERRIFPGAEPPTLEQMTRIFPHLAFILCDVENLRPHYALTLQHWRERFEAQVDEVEAMFDENFVRMWRLYLCGSIAAFTAGRLQLFQVLFRRPGSRAIPPTRDHLYAPGLVREVAAPAPPAAAASRPAARSAGT